MAADNHADIEPLMLASRAILAAAVRALESVDPSVTVPQMRVLVLLWTGEPLNLSTVAERLGVNPSNASRTCDRLVAAGLVQRTEGFADRRQISLTLTREGQILVDRLMQRRQHELTAVLARMSSRDQHQLMLALGPFNDAAQTDLWPGQHTPQTRDSRLLEWGL